MRNKVDRRRTHSKPVQSLKCNAQNQNWSCSISGRVWWTTDWDDWLRYGNFDRPPSIVLTCVIFSFFLFFPRGIFRLLRVVWFDSIFVGFYFFVSFCRAAHLMSRSNGGRLWLTRPDEIPLIFNYRLQSKAPIKDLEAHGPRPYSNYAPTRTNEPVGFFTQVTGS